MLTQKQEYEAILSQSMTDPTKYRITPFLREGFPLEFKVTPGGIVIVKNVDTGITAKDGQIYVSDIISLYPGLASQGISSTFDEENQTITFSMIYTGADGKGVYAVEIEKFLMDEALAKSFAKSMKKTPVLNMNTWFKKNYIIGIPAFNLNK